MAELVISDTRIVGTNQQTFIIAEIGQNHQGDLNTAKQLIRVAKESGADCVKFQKTCLVEKFNKGALNRPYTGFNSWGSTYGDHKRFLEFDNEQFLELQMFAKKIDIFFTASAMDLNSLEFLRSIKVPFIKIGSGDSNNLIMIKEAAAMNIPLVISTGMQDLKGVKAIYRCVSKFHKNFALLHCVSSYPTPLEDVNLNVINLYKEEFPDVAIGYSGHELGTDISLAAVALGAKIIERHITLGKNQKGSDHKSSLEPTEFKALIRKIRELETALGKAEKKFQKSEQPCFEKLGKSIVASKFLENGRTLQLSDLKIKVSEPKGIDASFVFETIGKQMSVEVGEDEPISEDSFV